MPSDAARAAFDEAQRIAAQMRDVHAREANLSAMLGQVNDHAAREASFKEPMEFLKSIRQNPWRLKASA
jgi:hypothetical protein